MVVVKMVCVKVLADFCSHSMCDIAITIATCIHMCISMVDDEKHNRRPPTTHIVSIALAMLAVIMLCYAMCWLSSLIERE